MYCKDGWKKGLLGTSLFIGAIISGLITGVIANKFGRWNSSFYSMLLGGIGSLLLGISPNFYFSLVCYAMIGFLFSFLNNISVVINEIGNSDFVNLCTGAYGVAWSIHELIWVGLAYYI